MAETTLTQPDDMIPNSFEKRILVVDDVALVCQVVVNQLRSAGFENVASETDPRLVLDAISEFKPDMVLLDILMPNISGLEVLQQIRSKPEMDKIIVLMLSAAGRDEQYESLELGA
jgi:CheY-like chemotaxis protein